MATGDSDVEEEEAKSEVSILDLKENMHFLSKRKLISMISSLIDDFQELTCERDQLFNDFANQRFECMDLKLQNCEKTNKQTNSFKIVNKLSDRVHNEKTSIGFHKQNVFYEDLCYISDKIGHPTTKFPVANDFRKRNNELENGNRFIHVDINMSTNLFPIWVKRNLIHPFDHKKGPKLVWVSKTNP
ncbi:hypothetical protein R3W88_024676 [Solanum pinnatisectum]|uniref:Uncharacterized protein n=1 Tax=Solanum pinnatisectum TaxID=50273 RepID=A0AAV9M1W7_9SOLN|nr:hypothetical protein R3W88_024676 [Solanum pinnatisectum]